MCLGKKDCLSLVKLEIDPNQKILVLINLMESYALYKEDHSNPIVGFSTFASLRLKFCILAENAGTHPVCVFIYHQNTKLQICSLRISEIVYELLMEKNVCSIDNRSCMIYLCNFCPKQKGVINF